MHGVVKPAGGRQPAASREHGAAHDPRGPDVAEDPALVPEPVQLPGLSEELVEPVLVLGGHLAAHLGDLRLDIRRVFLAAVDGRPDRPEQRVGQLERGRLGDVEAVQETVADEVEVAGDGGSRRPPEARAGRRGPRRGRRPRPAAPGRQGRARSRRSASRAPSTRRPTRATRRASGRAAAAGGSPVQSPTCARKSPVGTTALAVKRMCCTIIAEWWSRQRPRYDTSSSSESASGSTASSSRCFAIEAGLHVKSHSRSCSSQSFPAKTSSAR